MNIEKNLFYFALIGLATGYIQKLLFGFNMSINLFLIVGTVYILADNKSQIKLYLFFFIYTLFIISGYFIGLIFIMLIVWQSLATLILRKYINFSIIFKFATVLLVVAFWHIMFWIIFRPIQWQVSAIYSLIEVIIILAVVSLIGSRQKKLIIV